MANLQQILSWFKTGLFPTEDQFRQTWLSFWHKSEKIPQSQILGLQETIESAAQGLIWQEPVKNVADLSTAYPNAQKFWAAMVTSVGYIYSFNGSAWKNTGLTAFPANVATKDDLAKSEYDETVFNVTQKVPLTTGFYTEATARAAVPAAIRKPGLIITYATATGEWTTEQFIGANVADWANEANWEAIVGAGATFEEYGIFPDETIGIIDFIGYIGEVSGTSWIPTPHDLDTIDDRYYNTDLMGHRMFLYPIIPERTYNIRFYAQKATAVRAFPTINGNAAGRSIYTISSDLPQPTLMEFTFKSGKNDNLILITLTSNSAMPVVEGAKSRFYRFLDNGKMELKPVLSSHPSYCTMDIGTGVNYSNGQPYHTKSSIVTSVWSDYYGYYLIVYKLDKSKMYDFNVNMPSGGTPMLAVIPIADLPSITAFQEKGTLRSFPNTKWTDVFWNDSGASFTGSSRRFGFKQYLCEHDNMYLVYCTNMSYADKAKLIEYNPVEKNILFKYKEFDIQKYVPNYLGKINIIGTFPTAKPTVNRCDAEISVGNVVINTKIDLSVQGHITALFDKKGFTMDILTSTGSGSQKIQFGAWRPYDSYYLKAYMYDPSKCRDILSNRLFEQMKLTLPVDRQRNWERFGNIPVAPVGATGHIDGIPFELYNNGAYYGLYVLNIKKTRDNYMMDKKNSDQIWLDVGNTVLGGLTVPWDVMEIRNPSGVDEGAVPPDSTFKTAIEDFWKWNMSWSTKTKEEIEGKIDIVSIIDSYILHVILNTWDSITNNMFFSTYNGGKKWFHEIYDYNDTWGKYGPDAGKITDSIWFEVIQRADFIRINQLYFNEIRFRWKMLADAGVMTVENIVNQMLYFFRQFGYDGVKKDSDKWNLGDGLIREGTTQLERYATVAMASLNNAFDVYENNSKIPETDMFK
jgi:hypothetical protein